MLGDTREFLNAHCPASMSVQSEVYRDGKLEAEAVDRENDRCRDQFPKAVGSRPKRVAIEPVGPFRGRWPASACPHPRVAEGLGWSGGSGVVVRVPR